MADWWNLDPHCRGVPPTPREGHATVHIESQKCVIYFGGRTEEGLTDEVLRLEIGQSHKAERSSGASLTYIKGHLRLCVTREWSRLQTSGAIPAPRFDHAACIASNNSVWSFGGCESLEPAASSCNSMHRLDLSTAAWAAVPAVEPWPPAVTGASLTEINGHLFLCGGRIRVDGAESLPLQQRTKPTNMLWSFDPTSSKWTDLSSHDPDKPVDPSNVPSFPPARRRRRAPPPRSHHVAFRLPSAQECLVIACGRGAADDLADVRIYCTKTRSWIHDIAVTGTIPAGRYSCGWMVIETDATRSMLVVHGGLADRGIMLRDDLYGLTLPSANEIAASTMSAVTAAASSSSPPSPSPSPLTLSWTAIPTLGRKQPPRGGHGQGMIVEETAIVQGKMIKKQAAIFWGGRTNTNSGHMLLSSPLSLDTSRFLSHQSTSSAPSRSWKLSDFKQLHTLGTGSFGRVKFVQHIGTGDFFALKILKKSEIIRLKQIEHMLNERAILASVKHPFIVQLYASFQDSRYIYLVLEYVPGGEFFSLLRRQGRLKEHDAAFYAAHVVLIYQYLHSKDTVYRDLKPENLLIDSQGRLKLTDFGFAKIIDFRTFTLCGTPEYIAPEILLNKGHGKPADWWALGILIFEMLSGNPPFVDDTPMGIYQRVLGGQIKFPKYFSPNAIDLIGQLCQADISKRIGNLHAGAQDVRNHPFFSHIDWNELHAGRSPPPWKPDVAGASDTSLFDSYDEREVIPPEVATHVADPFINF